MHYGFNTLIIYMTCKSISRTFFTIIILLIIVFRLFIGEPCHIPSPSMEPTLLVGDWLWLDKTTYGGKLPKRFADIPILNIFTWIPFLREADLKNDWGDCRFPGIRKPLPDDIVVFFNPQNKEELYVKRIDTVIRQGDSIVVDSCNYALIEEIARKDKKEIKIIRDSVFIENNHVLYYQAEHDYYFMKGDNEKNSLDSRDYGYIPEESIVGKINTIIFSTFKEEDDGWIYFRKGRFFVSPNQAIED